MEERELERLRTQWWARLRGIQALPPVRRLEAIRGAVRENLQLKAASSSAIFGTTFGDVTGADYWQAWLCEKRSDTVLVDTLALHSTFDLQRYRRQLDETREAVAQARAEGARDQSPKRDAVAVVALLLESPLRQHLVPNSLKRWLERSESDPAPVPSRAPPKTGPVSGSLSAWAGCGGEAEFRATAHIRARDRAVTEAEICRVLTTWWREQGGDCAEGSIESMRRRQRRDLKKS